MYTYVDKVNVAFLNAIKDNFNPFYNGHKSSWCMDWDNNKKRSNYEEWVADFYKFTDLVLKPARNIYRFVFNGLIYIIYDCDYVMGCASSFSIKEGGTEYKAYNIYNGHLFVGPGELVESNASELTCVIKPFIKRGIVKNYYLKSIFPGRDDIECYNYDEIEAGKTYRGDELRNKMILGCSPVYNKDLWGEPNVDKIQRC